MIIGKTMLRKAKIFRGSRKKQEPRYKEQILEIGLSFLFLDNYCKNHKTVGVFYRSARVLAPTTLTTRNNFVLHYVILIMYVLYKFIDYSIKK